MDVYIQIAHSPLPIPYFAYKCFLGMNGNDFKEKTSPMYLFSFEIPKRIFINVIIDHSSRLGNRTEVYCFCH